MQKVESFLNFFSVNTYKEKNNRQTDLEKTDFSLNLIFCIYFEHGKNTHFLI
jgi:hypothetical protein